MSTITTEQVKELRDSTGVSVMQCRNALVEADGDMEKALIILKQKSSSIAMKKADREAHDGTIVVKEDTNKTILLALHCETDFVARNEDFLKLASDLSNIALTEGIDALNTKKDEMINPLIQKIGEKIELGRVEEIKGSSVGSYVHNGKSAVVVSLAGADKETARDIAMHIAAMKPVYTNLSDITEEDKIKVVEVFAKEVEGSDKPEDIKKKILEGKINTYFKEQTLLEQSFIKNPDLTISKLLESKGAKFVSFIRESI